MAKSWLALLGIAGTATFPIAVNAQQTVRRGTARRMHAVATGILAEKPSLGSLISA